MQKKPATQKAPVKSVATKATTNKTTTTKTTTKSTVPKTTQQAKAKPTTATKAPVKQVSKSGAATKQAPSKQTPTKSTKEEVKQNQIEEVKSNQKEEKKVDSIFDESKIITTKLTQIETALDDVKSRGKLPLIYDLSNNFSVFLKYKGTIIDFSEYLIKKALNQANEEEFLEQTRKKFVGSFKIGYRLALFFSLEPSNIGEILKGQKYYQPEKLFNPKILTSEEYYKPNFLTEEEDVDNFGNKGFFKQDPNFQLLVLLNGDKLESIKKNELGLPLEFFEVIKITE